MSRTILILLSLTAFVFCDNLPWPQRGHDTRLTRHVNNDTIPMLGTFFTHHHLLTYIRILSFCIKFIPISTRSRFLLQ
jgi:hypothetical protein